MKEKLSEYKQAVIDSMGFLAKDSRTIFIGQNVLYSGRVYGTLVKVPEDRCIELPVAEEMQTGIAIGLSLEGFIPVSIYQRMDFLYRAMDQICNHLDKIKELSYGEFGPHVIIRVTIGSKSPLNPGIQHSQDLTEVFKKAVSFSVCKVETPAQVLKAYKNALVVKKPCMIIETAELYG